MIRHRLQKQRVLPEAFQRFRLFQLEWELLTRGMVGDSGEFAECRVNVFGTDADAILGIGLERLRIDRNGELTCVGRADHLHCDVSSMVDLFE